MELLQKGQHFCRKHQKKNGECKKSCPLRNTMCISSDGNLIFRDELPDYNTAGINFLGFTRQFRNMVKVISSADREKGDLRKW